MSQSDDQITGGCLGLILGFIIIGLVSLGVGLIFLPFLKAVGVSILGAVVGAAIFSVLGYRIG